MLLTRTPGVQVRAESAPSCASPLSVCRQAYPLARLPLAISFPTTFLRIAAMLHLTSKHFAAFYPDVPLHQEPARILMLKPRVIRAWSLAIRQYSCLGITGTSQLCCCYRHIPQHTALCASSPVVTSRGSCSASRGQSAVLRAAATSPPSVGSLQSKFGAHTASDTLHRKPCVVQFSSYPLSKLPDKDTNLAVQARRTMSRSPAARAACPWWC